MKLTSTTDRKIKRYLKNNATKYNDCISNESIHAQIKTMDGNGNETIVHVRFSDHFTPNKKNEINIVKLNDTSYHMCVANTMQYTMNNNTILNFIKAQILLFNNIKDTLTETNENRKNVLKAYNAYKSKINEEEIIKKDETIKTLEEENKTLKNKMKQIKKLVNDFKSITGQIKEE